jgi:hypothetical protein
MIVSAFQSATARAPRQQLAAQFTGRVPLLLQTSAAPFNPQSAIRNPQSAIRNPKSAI